MMKSDKGMTLLEALVSTVIIGIGFVAVFQMVNYSIRSIDVSSDRTKANYLVSMVAEDLISEKNADSGDSTNPKLKDYLAAKQSKSNSWDSTQNVVDECKPKAKTGLTKIPDKKFEKWRQYFANKRLKCESGKTTKVLKVYDICSSLGGSSCSYTSNSLYTNSTNKNKYRIYEKRIYGKMQLKVRTGGKRDKTKYLYFQID